MPEGNDFVAIAAGDFHGLALRSDGSLAGWGPNWDGQTNVPPGNDFTAIAAGDCYGLALKSDGSLVGWGLNDFGQIDVPSGYRFRAIAAGRQFVAAIAEPILAWDGTGEGNWDSGTHWNGRGPRHFPDQTTHAVVRADRVTVAGDGAALSLRIDGPRRRSRGGAGQHPGRGR